ncbi:MAG TPA: 2,3-bisphosphoglycerate-independent phosphoglycerate mutase [Nevskiaceae bacterium]|nr:2,3-bisphosphoglycerate-independent phosphoglycerate mutase [Nevskiaceae bacterium]
MTKPVVLIIMDGWGIAPDGPGNAVTQAKTPTIDNFWAAYPRTQLIASGEAVGLPKNENGNSETGHLNLGAGKIVFQDLPRINMAIADGSFFQKPAFKAAAEHVRKNKSSLHLLGLIGSGGVHSSLEHILALIHFAKQESLPKLFLHLFTDGRDSAPTSALTYIDIVETELKKIGFGQIASLCGRYWAMDRDNRWQRTQKAYDALTLGKGKFSSSPAEGIKASYKEGKTDEFLEPVILTDKNNQPIGLINDNDAVIFFNFRIDRPRQLTKAFVLPNFETLVIKKAAFDPYAERYGLHLYEVPQETTTFKRTKIIQNLFFVTMTEFEKKLPTQTAFPPTPVEIPLARVLSEKSLRQLHIAETEKERFVTYYFDGQREAPFPGEDRIEISSPKVATYDKKPEMSAYEVTSELVKRLKTNIYDFVVVNYANPDMVGHTGVLSAGVKACEVVDECVGKVVNTVLGLGGSCLITADHGNVEEMINLTTGGVDTEHSNNPVPLIVVSQHFRQKAQNLPQGILADVAPTILDLMEINKPELMTGRSLLL